MGTLWQDLKYGIRMLLKHPGLTFVAVFSLSLGIGANATVFSWARAILLNPVPGVREPDRLMSFFGRAASGSATSTSYPDYVDLRDKNEVLSGLIVYDLQAMSLSVNGQAERVYGSVVSGNYFDVLGVKAAQGRTFLPEENKVPGARAVTVISHKLWQRSFAGDPGVVGQTVMLNDHPFTIVGVAPENFSGAFVGLSMDLYVPIMMQQQIVPGGNLLAERGDHWLEAMARLKPGIELQQAQSNLETISQQLAQAYPATNEGRSAMLLPVWKSPWGAQYIFRPVLAVLGAVVGLVLLIACANVANLLLARAVSRRREIAIRLAMGAGRFRLVRQLLTESLLLALMGGAGGFLMSVWSSRILVSFVPPTDMPIGLNIPIDGAVFSFALLVSVVTGLIFGLAPALQASSPNLVTALKDDAARGGGPSRSRLRNALVIAQVALSLVLLIGAALFLQSLKKAQSIDPGFNPKNVLLASLDLFPNGYTPETGRIFQQQLLQRIEALPEVQSATLARRVPLGFAGTSSMGIAIDGYEPRPNEEMSVEYNVVGPNYFRAMGIPLLNGRDFTSQDVEQSQRVIVINEAMARRYWPEQDPIGKPMNIGSKTLTIVGVAKTGKYHSLGEEPRPFMYLPVAQSYRPDMILIVRTSGDPTSLLPAVRETVRAMNSSLPLFEVNTLTAHMAISVFTQRIAATLLGVFGLLALSLAALGLYGVMAYSVGQRTHEIGLRMALGAAASEVVKLIVKQGLTIALAGVAIGLAGAFAVTRFLASLLHGISSTDLTTFLGAAAILILVALLASYIPARKATKVDPMVALRCE